MTAFNLKNYLATSRALDVSDIDFEEAARHPTSAGELRCLHYMMDIEAHTLCYLRDLLNAHAAADPEIADFLGCWLYEEAYHGRAIERFLSAVGSPRPAAVCGARRLTLRERFENLGTGIIGALRDDFHTVHMTWGSIQEVTTLTGYRRLSSQSLNPVLIEILERIMRDEARHFSFYYSKAAEGLASPSTRRLTAFLVRRWWGPVGTGVKSEDEVDFMLRRLFGDAPGREAARHIDRTIARLPGMGWFGMMTARVDLALSRPPSAQASPALQPASA